MFNSRTKELASNRAFTPSTLSAIPDKPLDVPIVVAPETVATTLISSDQIIIVYVSTKYRYAQGHIPGAVFLDYHAKLEPIHGHLGEGPADVASFSRLLSDLGIAPDTHIIAYDEEGGGKAGRFCWALDSFGHERWSLLDGGRPAWVREGYRLDDTVRENIRPLSRHSGLLHKNTTATKDYILARLGSMNTIILDTRTRGEFSGEDYLTSRAGHIPGAINLDWTHTMDPALGGRLKSREDLIALFHSRGLDDKEQEIITYCHAHQRAAHTYVVLKHLGYRNIKGYCGAWLEWGNAHDTPVEIA